MRLQRPELRTRVSRCLHCTCLSPRRCPSWTAQSASHLSPRIQNWQHSRHILVNKCLLSDEKHELPTSSCPCVVVVCAWLVPIFCAGHVKIAQLPTSALSRLGAVTAYSKIHPRAHREGLIYAKWLRRLKLGGGMAQNQERMNPPDWKREEGCRAGILACLWEKGKLESFPLP